MNIKEQGRKVLKQQYYIENADINFKGAFLGYDWNTICDWISTCGIYGEDGSGSYIVSRDEYKFKVPEMNEIFDAIFEENPQADEISVID